MMNQTYLQIHRPGLIAFGMAMLIDLTAQTVTPRASTPSAEEQPVVTLEAFTVSADTNAGYGAQNASSSSRLNLRYVDVPQTINVVTSEFLTDAFIFDSREFTTYVNNISPRTNTHQPETFFIRGLQTTTSYVDGFLATISSNRDAALYNRVEYVKGPASAAIGRGEAGGLVNFIQKKPTGRRGVDLRGTFGTDDFHRAEIDYHGVLIPGKLTYRVPVYYETSNSPRGGSLLHTEKKGIGPALAWRPFPRTEVNLTTAYFRHRTPGAVASAHWMHQDLVDMRVDQGGINRAVWYSGPNTPLVPIENVYTYPHNFRRFDVSEASLIITHKFLDNLTLRQAMRVERVRQKENRFATPPAVARNAAMPSGYQITMSLTRLNREDEGGRSQTELLYETEIKNTRHLVMGGFDAFQDHGFSRQGTRSGIFLDLYRPDLTPPPDFTPESWVAINRNGDNKNWGEGHGYYGQYSGSFFRDRLQVMAGWRQDRTEARTLNLRTNPTGSRGNPRIETTEAPRYSISYKPLRWLTAYFVHSEQADPVRSAVRWSPDVLLNGATSYTDGRRPESERIFSNVQALMKEYGIKASLLDGRLTASVAYFDMSRNGFIQNEPKTEVGANGIGTIQYNENYIADGETADGIEIEIFGQPTRRLTFTFGAVFQEGTNPRANGIIQPIDTITDEFMFHGKYSFRDADRNGFEITGGGKYWVGGWTISNGSFKTFDEDQYLLDLGAAYYWRKGKYGVHARVNNVFDDTVFITENSQRPLRRAYLGFSARF